jgi:hypothetical protein
MEVDRRARRMQTLDAIASGRRRACAAPPRDAAATGTAREFRNTQEAE